MGRRSDKGGHSLSARSKFLPTYLDALPSIPGWLEADAALMFMAYNQIIGAQGIAGDVLEIGVYHGKSAITVAALRGSQGRFFAVDLFDDLQSGTAVNEGIGMKAAFLHNVGRFFPKVDFMNVISTSSADLTPEELGRNFSFCHIDGDHRAGPTYKDVALCCEVLRPGGLLAMDDYFNPLFPGVVEGAVRFGLDHPGALIPLAIGFNKALFQRGPVDFNANGAFAEVFPYIPRHVTELWEQPAFLFLSGLVDFVDIPRSTPRKFVPRAELQLQASIEPQLATLHTSPGQPTNLPVRVVNQSSVSFAWGISLSYHLYTDDALVQWENGRCIFDPPLPPGEEQVVNLGVQAPTSPGRYLVELDLVWEGISWFKEKGNRTATVELAVA